MPSISVACPLAARCTLDYTESMKTKEDLLEKKSNPFSTEHKVCKEAKQLSFLVTNTDPLQAVQLVGIHKLYTLNGGAMSTSAAHCKKYM